MSNPGSAGFDPAAAFTGAAQQFLALLQTLGVASAAPAGTGGPQGGAAGQAGSAWNPAAVTAALTGQFEQWLRSAQLSGPWLRGSIPGAGAAAGPGGSPHPAAQLWELLQRVAALQGQLAPYWSEIAAEAGRRFAARQQALPDRPASLDQALVLYERWVECAEAAYAATVCKPEFCRLQAQLVNASAELLAWQRRQGDVLAQTFGLPTRAELSALQTQLQEVRAAGSERAAQPAGARAARAKRRKAKAVTKAKAPTKANTQRTPRARRKGSARPVTRTARSAAPRRGQRPAARRGRRR